MEEKKENQGQIEAVPSAFSYVVEVDGEKVSTENIETAIILSKLEKIHQEIKDLKEK